MNKHRLRRFFWAFVCICLTFFLTWSVAEFVGQRTEVEGMSMSPTLKDKENLILDKISYRFRAPERYEIVVVPPNYKENTYYIKRVIGLPGETVQIRDGDVYIDGMRLEEDGAYGKIKDPGLAAEPFLLGEEEYFVLGDNRNDSIDSREPEVGAVRREDILGRAFFRLWPLSEFGFLSKKA